jgi:diaminopimelate epimerase
MEKNVHHPQHPHRLYRVTIADPAGNITALIEAADNEPASVSAWTDNERRHIVRRIMREYPDVEQAGFVIPGRNGASDTVIGGEPGSGEAPRFSLPLWRLEMAGGEFCGNAARSFGLFVAQRRGLCGQSSVPVTVSGVSNPLTVLVDTQNSTAEIALPPPRKMETLRYRGAHLPVFVFDGITHIIMEGIDKDTDKAALTETFFAVKQIADATLNLNTLNTTTEPPAAFGVMFYDTTHDFLRPAVFVNGIETFVFENSCGSGSAALAWHRAFSSPDGTYCQVIEQPGGTITTRLIKENGKITSVFIGGNVYFR